MEGQWKHGLLLFGRVSPAPDRIGDVYFGSTTRGVCYKRKTDCHRHVGCSTGYKIEGSWLKGLRHGQGTFYWRNGASWQGTFNHGKPIGQGQHYCPATGEITSDVWWSSQFDCCCSCPDALALHRPAM